MEQIQRAAKIITERLDFLQGGLRTVLKPLLQIHALDVVHDCKELAFNFNEIQHAGQGGMSQVFEDIDLSAVFFFSAASVQNLLKNHLLLQSFVPAKPGHTAAASANLALEYIGHLRLLPGRHNFSPFKGTFRNENGQFPFICSLFHGLCRRKRPFPDQPPVQRNWAGCHRTGELEYEKPLPGQESGSSLFRTGGRAL